MKSHEIPSFCPGTCPGADAGDVLMHVAPAPEELLQVRRTDTATSGRQNGLYGFYMSFIWIYVCVHMIYLQSLCIYLSIIYIYIYLSTVSIYLFIFSWGFPVDFLGLGYIPQWPNGPRALLCQVPWNGWFMRLPNSGMMRYTTVAMCWVVSLTWTLTHNIMIYDVFQIDYVLGSLWFTIKTISNPLFFFC